MVIKFACPNGHPLSAGDELAGKPGKCPQCQAMFLVPESPGAPANTAAAKSGGTIAFLCPNGHKLTGPRTLQGKAGQCPHCGSKFRIPSYETPAEVRMLELFGVDAVGMSTVHEVIVARAIGMRVAGMSCITNLAAGLTAETISHEDVLEVTKAVGEKFEKIAVEFVRHLEVL